MKNLSCIFLLLFLLSGTLNSQEKVDILILDGKLKEAMQLLDKCIQTHPEAGLFLKKGTILNMLHDYQEALSNFFAAKKMEPGNMEIPAAIADAYAALGNFHEAIAYYEKAVEIDSKNLSLAGKLGRNYIKLDNYDKAYDVFSEIYQVDSTNVYWNKQFAYSAYKTGKIKQAISLYENVICMNPGDYSSYMNLIKLYQQSEQPNEKQRVIESGLKQFPGDAGFYHVQASHYFGIRNYEEAKQAYEKYFVAGGDSAYKTMLNYGVSVYFSKNEAIAVSIFEFCTRQIANDPYVLFYLALSFKKMGHYEIAQSYMNAAIESAMPSYVPDMYHHLGQILGQQRKFEESVAALKKANELDPANYEVLFEIATTYEEYNSNKTLALNYYNVYLKEAGAAAKNAGYALDRMTKIKEELFFDK